MTSRRQFLKTGLAGTVAAPLLRGQARAAVADVDVVVIGAGIAGLAAARDLVKLGYQTIVLEAAAQPGGRIKTDRSLGTPIDVGAGWIHGPQGNPITGLARAAGAKTFATSDESYRVFRADGTPVPKAEVESAYGRWQTIQGKIDDALDPDMSLADAIARVHGSLASDPVVDWMTSAYTEFDTGGPIDRLSGYYYDEDKAYSGQDVILLDGYDRITRHLARGLDIRLNTRVSSVAYAKGDGATITTNAGDLEASFVVCTVPLGVLKAGDIAFDPPLPQSHRSKIQRIGMGNVTKVALKFSDAFWPTDVQYFGVMTDLRGRWNYMMNHRTFSPQNVLTGVAVGAYAARAEEASETAMARDMMGVVRAAFGGAEVPEPIAVKGSRWSKDPNTKGAYSYTAVGTKPSDFNGLADPIEDVVLLAGEHTTFDHHGTVHGAYDSGRRAARVIETRLAD